MRNLPICLIEINENDEIIFINDIFSSELQKIDIISDDLLSNKINLHIKNFNKSMHRKVDYIYFGNRTLYSTISVKESFIFIEVFNYNISLINHINQEFKAPLTSSIKLTKMLSDTNLSTKQNEHVTMLKESQLKLIKSINDTVDYLSLLSNNVILVKERFKISTAIIQVEKLLKVPIELKLTFDYSDVYVYTDYSRFVELLVHLISHCCSHTSKGFINIKSKNNDEKILTMYITDTGKKLSKLSQELLFCGFNHIDTSLMSQNDYNLELSIAKHIARLMNGDIILEKTEEYGSIYKYYLDIIS